MSLARSIKVIGSLLSLTTAGSGFATTATSYLVKATPEGRRALQSEAQVLSVQDLGIAGWAKVTLTTSASSLATQSLASVKGVIAVQENRKYGILENYRIRDPHLMEKIQAAAASQAMSSKGRPLFDSVPADNPEIPAGPKSTQTGADPMVGDQWGMKDIGAAEAQKKAENGATVTVAVIDTGIDYTHEDLLPVLWRNAGEMGKDAKGNDKSTNGVDDDANGYTDDVVGWDFASDDNKPYDLMSTAIDLITKGGNPGHGTHCSGNVGAAVNNKTGIIGAGGPNIKVMGLRFISDKGEGDTAGAIAAIKYAVDNGARVLSNSWGGISDGTMSDEDNALKDAINYAQDKNVIFIVAAGNGDPQTGKGYDIDAAKPVYPAAFDNDNIVTVAAMDVDGKLGTFSNWGSTSVDIGAPGVNVFSSVPKYGYEDVLLDLSSLGMGLIRWDGTSMATPHVAGAAALYLSTHPKATWSDIKDALLSGGKDSGVLKGKTTSGKKLDAKALTAN